MKQHAEKFLDEWVEKCDLIQVCSLATRQRLSGWHHALSPAEEISETDLTEAFNGDTRFSALEL
jgi:hypothetical protein